MAAILLVIGGVNWGLVGAANFDLVAWVSGAGGFGARNEFGTAIYLAVGLAALYQAFTWRSMRRRWARVAP
jgi:hypothetical protein